jgi:hypothetical protein
MQSFASYFWAKDRAYFRAQREFSEKSVAKRIFLISTLTSPLSQDFLAFSGNLISKREILALMLIPIMNLSRRKTRGKRKGHRA